MKIIAHRGASFYAPENTISSFKLAMDFGVDGFEIDVHMTKDKKIVVIHDPSTGRTGTKNYKIQNSKFQTLQRVDVGSWFDSKYKGEKISLLEHVIEISRGKFDLYIEIKSGTEIINTFCRLLEKYESLANKFIVFSFNYEVITILKNIFSNFTMLWIVEYGYNVSIEKYMYKNVLKKIEKACLNGISTFADINHCIKMAKDIKSNNWFWNVWTVDNPYLAKQFMNLGVNSLSTNRPDWIIRNLV